MLYKRTLLTFSLFFVVSFAFIACHHDPGHSPPGQGGDSPCGDEAGAVWTNQPSLGGAVEINWGPPTSAPGNRNIEVISSAPLVGNFNGGYGQVRNNNITMSSPGSEITFCCGRDNLMQGGVVSQATQTNVDFDGSSSWGTLAVDNMDFINLQAWVLLRCRPSGDNYTNASIGIPVSVLSSCQKPNGDQYEVETVITHNVTATCTHN